MTNSRKKLAIFTNYYARPMAGCGYIAMTIALPKSHKHDTTKKMQHEHSFRTVHFAWDEATNEEGMRLYLEKVQADYEADGKKWGVHGHPMDCAIMNGGEQCTCHAPIDNTITIGTGTDYRRLDTVFLKGGHPARGYFYCSTGSRKKHHAVGDVIHYMQAEKLDHYGWYKLRVLASLPLPHNGGKGPMWGFIVAILLDAGPGVSDESDSDDD